MSRRGYKITYPRHTPNTMNACGKVAYDDRVEADTAAQERSKLAGLPIYVYWCLACFSHHLTSKPRRP